ncbi:hypothetical protein EPO44_11695 [bacterium]|nr:MAG: hypothetical protein EPO44_11695 [bacterium]
METENAIRIVKREESLRSVQRMGVHIRLLYEDEWLELLATELEPGNAVDSRGLWDSSAVHFLIQGGFLFESSGRSVFLLPGDSIAVREGEIYKVSNPTSCRATLWSLLFKQPRQEDKNGQDRKTMEAGYDK